MKQCGDCMWCCFHPAWPGLKGPKEWCKHSEVGAGCRIYADRPMACSTFRCVWLQDAVMPDEFRPDRCGVMFEIPYGTKTIIGMVDPARPDAWKSERVRQLVNKFVKAGYPVKIRIG